MTDLFAGGEPLPIPLEAQIAAVEREIGMRLQVYGRRVDAGQMKRERAHAEIAAMRAVLRTLKGIHEAPKVDAAANRLSADYFAAIARLDEVTAYAEQSKRVIEHGTYLADAATSFMDKRNAFEEAREKREDAEPGEEAAAAYDVMYAAEEALSDAGSGLRNAVYEFEKRRDRIDALSKNTTEVNHETPDRMAPIQTTPRFFIDHGCVHDRKTGQHVGMEAEPQHAERLLALLQSLESPTELNGVFNEGVLADDFDKWVKARPASWNPPLLAGMFAAYCAGRRAVHSQGSQS